MMGMNSMPNFSPTYGNSYEEAQAPLSQIQLGGVNFGGAPMLGNPIPSNGFFQNRIQPPNSIFRGFVTVPIFSKPLSYNFGPNFPGMGLGPAYVNGKGMSPEPYQSDEPYPPQLPFTEEEPAFNGYRYSTEESGGYHASRSNNYGDLSFHVSPRVDVSHDESRYNSAIQLPLPLPHQDNFADPSDDAITRKYFESSDRDIGKYKPTPFPLGFDSVSNTNVGYPHYEGFSNYADIQPTKRSQYGKPYVFTKDHVGFGPITVEAKTANAKEEDPKDDE